MSWKQIIRQFFGWDESQPIEVVSAEIPHYQTNPSLVLTQQANGQLLASLASGANIILTQSLYNLLGCWETPLSIETVSQRYRQQFNAGLSAEDLQYLVEDSLLPDQLLILVNGQAGQ